MMIELEVRSKVEMTFLSFYPAERGRREYDLSSLKRFDYRNEDQSRRNGEHQKDWPVNSRGRDQDDVAKRRPEQHDADYLKLG